MPRKYNYLDGADKAMLPKPHFADGDWTIKQIKKWLDDGFESDKLNHHEKEYYRPLIIRAISMQQVALHPFLVGEVSTVLTPFLASVFLNVLRTVKMQEIYIARRERKNGKIGDVVKCICYDCITDVREELRKKQ